MEVSLDRVRLSSHVQHLRSLIDQALPGLVTDQYPAELYDPVSYILAGKGKRFRPLLVILAAEIFEAKPESALPAALAVEVFHNFTLVHDDIMDHAPSRRGRATVHERWDESTAILCGDYLLALAYDQLAKLETTRLNEILHRYFWMVSRLCEGQALDKAFESRDTITVDEYLHMIDCKTGALLQMSLELGGFVGNATPEQRRILESIGRHIGRAFQIQDDLLDLIAEDARWGKPIGGDLIEGKKTYLLLHAIENAQGEQAEWFARIVRNRGLPETDVSEAKRRMEELGSLQAAQNEVHRHISIAKEKLDQLPSGIAGKTLVWLFEEMQARVH